jgi:putative endonuclease
MSPAPTLRTRRGRTGIAAEGTARRYLEAAGWTILGANVLVGRGELDLVALDPAEPGTLVVVEVRGARSGRFGSPEESVDPRKLARLRAAVGSLVASGWPADHGVGRWRSLRIDVIAVDLDPVLTPVTSGPVVRHLRGVTG